MYVCTSQSNEYVNKICEETNLTHIINKEENKFSNNFVEVINE